MVLSTSRTRNRLEERLASGLVRKTNLAGKPLTLVGPKTRQIRKAFGAGVLLARVSGARGVGSRAS